jgi:hypothetical protein
MADEQPMSDDDMMDEKKPEGEEMGDEKEEM